MLEIRFSMPSAKRISPTDAVMPVAIWLFLMCTTGFLARSMIGLVWFCILVSSNKVDPCDRRRVTARINLVICPRLLALRGSG